MKKSGIQFFRKPTDVNHNYWRWSVSIILLFFVAGIGAGGWYGYMQFTALTDRLDSLSQDLANVNERLVSETELLDKRIAQANTELNEDQDQINDINRQLGNFQQEVGSVSNTVSDLEKLSKVDKELLRKYSKVYFLNENYTPERTTELANKYEYFESDHSQLHSQVAPYLTNMLDAAQADGFELYVYSAYRPFDEQAALKEQYKVIYGEGTANQFSADQGYSEHQLGTTVDLITTGIGGTLQGFDETGAYQWLLDNAHKYGFTLSYPPGNQYYVYEPWHWRFVGVELATDLHQQGKHFYDLDQREIDEYLITLFEE